VQILRRIRAARPEVVLGIAWLVVLIYAFPGQMTADTFEHLGEAREGVYTDGHPPVMNVIFWIAEQLSSVPVAIFVLQTLAFLAGLYALLRRTFAPPRAAWIASALFVFPPVMTPLAVVWKDSIMACGLVWGVAALLDARRNVRLAGLLALFLATAVRYNAFAATFPLVFLLFEWRTGMHWLKRYAIAFAAWLVITMAAFQLNAALVDQKMYYWHSSLAVHDIVGTLDHVDDTLPDAELERLFAGTELLVHKDIHAHIRKLYTPKNFFKIVASDQAMWKLPVYGTEPAPEPQRDAIEHAWREVVTTYPRAYIAHRLAVMGGVLSFGHRPSAVQRRAFDYPQTVIDMGMSVRASALQHQLTSGLIVLEQTPLYRPWMYLALAFVMLAFTRRNRDVFALLASGIVLESTLVVLAPTPDYRYSHWMVVATCISITLLVARRARARVVSAQQ
jgi:hypothetical protein